MSMVMSLDTPAGGLAIDTEHPRILWVGTGARAAYVGADRLAEAAEIRRAAAAIRRAEQRGDAVTISAASIALIGLLTMAVPQALRAVPGRHSAKPRWRALVSDTIVHAAVLTALGLSGLGILQLGIFLGGLINHVGAH